MSRKLLEIESSRRIDEREQIVADEVRGLYTLMDSAGIDISASHEHFVVFDVSESGVGLLTTKPVKKDAKIKLTVGQPFLIVLEGIVAWSKEQKEIEGFRCGVQITGNQKRLQSIFDCFNASKQQPAKVVSQEA